MDGALHLKCSKRDSCTYPCNGKLPKHFDACIDVGLAKVMEVNAIPQAIGEKIALILEDNLDAASFCEHGGSYSLSVTPPRKRVLDRVIVHKFEQYYVQITEKLSEKKRQSNQLGDLFEVIPRGECLDLFLSLIKDHCMGNEQVKTFTQRIEVLTNRFSDEMGISWLDLYESDEYEACMNELFSIVFHYLKDRKVPIPALNIKLDHRYQPERINKLLRYMSKLWLNQHHGDSTEIPELK